MEDGLVCPCLRCESGPLRPKDPKKRCRINCPTYDDYLRRYYRIPSPAIPEAN